MAKRGKEKAAAAASSSSSSGQQQGPGGKASKASKDAKDAKDTKDDAKGSKGKKGAGASSASAATAEPDDPSAKPKPTVKQLIGGHSWTGKLPVTLLAEHVQRQPGWLKPDYSQHRNPDGTFSCFVTLSARDPKTQEVTRLDPFRIAPLHKHLLTRDSALESRHAAATYALYRVCSMQNKHMVLPPDHKALWKEFEAIKKDDVKDGKAWMYDADPFKTLRDRQEAKAAAEKKRKEIEDARAKAKDMPGAAGLVFRQKAGEGGGPNGTSASLGTAAGAAGYNPMRGWTNVPKMEMGRKTRAGLEALLRRKTVWNPHAVVMTPAQRNAIVAELTALGFRRSHVEEAVEYCKDREETLEWLLIHVPEDDTPAWALPETYSAGISVGATDLRRESAVKRLAETGYSIELCGRVYDDSGGNEAKAAEELQRILLGGDSGQDRADQSKASRETAEELLELAGLGAEEQWEDEVASLESGFGFESFVRESQDVVKVRLDVCLPRNVAKGKKKAAAVDGTNNEEDQSSAFVRMRRSPNYPAELVVTVVAPLPAYIKLSVVKRTLEYIGESLQGEPMKMYFVVDWLQHHLGDIAEKPGRLLDISTVSSAAAESNAVAAVPDRSRGPSASQKHPRPIEWVVDDGSRQNWLRRQERADWKRMVTTRQRLPAWQVRDRLVRTVAENRVTIISGETGSGKSTQSMQFVLDDLYDRGLGRCANMIITQPRRISALGLADRVAEERCGRVGDEVGYAIRGESRRGPDTRMTFVTTGVLLRRLQVSGGRIEDVAAALADVSHVVIDEVHERTLDTDFLLTLLREVMRMPDVALKLVLMSATLDAATFEDYFVAEGLSVGAVEIEGRTFPVEDYYLDDVVRMTGFGFDRGVAASAASADAVGKVIQKLGPRINYVLVAELVEAIDEELAYSSSLSSSPDKENAKPGAVLVFMPGVAEISQTCKALQAQSAALHVLPLHASLETREQKRVFGGAPAGKRKVVVATNVAETSITIDDVVVVVDAGRVKETSLDAATNVRRLEEVWASRAACKQRRGRAGRVQAGRCFKLFTRAVEQTQMAERPEPEMRRVPLEQLCLSVRAMGIRDAGAFLARAPSPPSSVAVDGAVRLLRRIGALDGAELTALGRQLSRIPADLRCAKLMVMGSMFGCLDECIAMAAILSTRSPFVAPVDRRDQARDARARFAACLAPGCGDVLTDLEAFRQWDDLSSSSHGGGGVRAVRDWCTDNFISYQTMADISTSRAQYYAALYEMGVSPSSSPPPSLLPPHSSSSARTSTTMLRALLAAAFTPQLARIQFPDKKFAASMSGAVELDPEARTIKFFNEDNGRVFVHPGSVLFGSQTFAGGNAAYMSYFGIMETSKVFIRDLTPFNAYALLMFSGAIELDTIGRGIVVDGWLRLRGWARIGVLVSRLRGLVDDVIAQKVEDPAMDLAGNEVLRAVRRLVELDGLDA